MPKRTWSRRRFVAWIGALAALAGAWRRPAPATRSSGAVAPEGDGGAVQPPPLPQPMLAALAAAVLPSSLGTGGGEGAARRFGEWIAAYRPGREVVHPYGSAELATLPPSPLDRWRRQLHDLDGAARARHHVGFTSLGVAERQQLVREMLAASELMTLPSPLGADHVAVALLAHWYASPEATDRCYDVRIQRQQCRPLVNAPRAPLPLATRGGA